MTLTSGFFNSVAHDRVYNARHFGDMFNGLITDGVFSTIGDQMRVFAGTGMQLNIGSGRAWFYGTWSYNDALTAVVIAPSDPLLSRIDIVYLEVNIDDTVRINSYGVLTGVPASSPVPPTYVQTATRRIYPLANVTVLPGTISVSQAQITNRVGTVDCPFATGILQQVTTNELIEQWQAQFLEWFEYMQDQLTEDAAGNLQTQIDAIKGGIIPVPITLLSLLTHNHTYGVTPQIPTDGVEDRAITEQKIALETITEPLIGTEAITPRTLSPGVAGNGLYFFQGLHLSLNENHLEVSGGNLRIKNDAITRDLLEVTIDGIYIPAEGLLGGSHVVDHLWGKTRALLGAHVEGVDYFVSGSFQVPYGIRSNNILVQVLYMPLSYGNVRFNFHYLDINAPLSDTYGTDQTPTSDLDVQLVSGTAYSPDPNYAGMRSIATFNQASNGSMIKFRLSRDFDHPEDTLVGGLEILGVRFVFSRKG